MDNELQRNLDSIFSSFTHGRPQASALSSWNLGDDGCMKLFERMVTSKSATGAGAIYCNPSLQRLPLLEHLDLSSNGLFGSKELAQALVAALQNNSRIKLLDLSRNPLSDSFRETFLVALQENKLNTLRVLKLDAIGLTAPNVGLVAAYLGSRHCRLLHLSISSNAIISDGCRDILNGLERCRSLERLDWDNNQPNVSYPSMNHGLPVYSALNGQFLAHKISGYINRNLAFKSQLSAEARELLQTSRILLLGSSIGSIRPFRSLPSELKQMILSLLAPTLSSRQHALVFSYASEKASLLETPPTRTIPSLLLRSPSRAQRASGPQSLPSSGVNRGNGKKFGSLIRTDTGSKTPEHLLSSTGLVVTPEVARTPSQVREDRRREWLELVGCEIYEGEES